MIKKARTNSRIFKKEETLIIILTKVSQEMYKIIEAIIKIKK